MRFKEIYVLLFLSMVLASCSKPYFFVKYDNLGYSKIVDRQKKSSKEIEYNEYFKSIVASNDCKLFGVFNDRIYKADESIGNTIIKNCLKSHVINPSKYSYINFISSLGFNCYDRIAYSECTFVGKYEGGQYKNLFYLIQIPTNGVKGANAGIVEVKILVILTKTLDIIYYDLSK